MKHRSSSYSAVNIAIELGKNVLVGGGGLGELIKVGIDPLQHKDLLFLGFDLHFKEHTLILLSSSSLSFIK